MEMELEMKMKLEMKLKLEMEMDMDMKLKLKLEMEMEMELWSRRSFFLLLISILFSFLARLLDTQGPIMGDKPSQQEIIQTYQGLRQEMSGIIQKRTELEAERTEHK